MTSILFKFAWLALLSGSNYGSSGWKFLKPPRPYNVVAFNDNFEINCSTNGINVRTSLLKFHSGLWLRISHPYLKNITFVRTGDIFKLLGVTMYDSGHYKCRATEISGKRTMESASFMLIPNVKAIPTMSVIPRGIIKLQVGESTKISCQSVSSSSLTWYKVVGKTVAPLQGNMRIITKAGPWIKKVILEIKQAKMSNSGDYKCVLTKRGRKKHQIVSLKVLPHVFKFAAPKPKTPLLPIPMASYLTMNCSTTDPKARTSLYHKVLHGSNWRRLTESEYTKKDHVYSVQISLNYAGQFKCIAINWKRTKIEWPSNAGLLVIPYTIKVPKLSVSPDQEKSLTVGENFNFTCSSNVNAFSKLKWVKVESDNMESPVPSSKTLARNIGNSMQLLLKIVNAKKGDSGIYKCVLKYANRKKHKFTSLKVFDIQPPKVTIRNRTPVVKINTKVIIRCLAEGYPKPVIQWYKNGKPMNVRGCVLASPKCRQRKYSVVSNSLTSTFVNSSLIIHEFKENGKVLFTCKASNRYGRAAADSEVKPDVFRFLNLKPRKLPAIDVVNFGTSVTIDCTTSDSNARSFLLYKDGSSWNPVSKSRIKSGSVYTISNFSVRDSMPYKCVAINSSGYKIEWPSAYGLYLLPDIIKIPKMAVFPIEEQIITVGKNLNFTCSSVARNAQLKWYREKAIRNTFEPVSVNKTIRISKTKQNQLVLTFRNATVNDSGFYKCAMNFRGKTDFEMVSVKVYEIPPFSLILHTGQKGPIAIKSGVRLACLFEGNPNITVQWYKDGQKIKVPRCNLSRSHYTCVNKKYRLRKNSSMSSRVQSVLKIKSFNRIGDAGVYRCTGSSSSQTVSARMKVGV